MYLILHILFLVVLLALSGFFSGTETALFSLSNIDRKRLRRKYPQLARLVLDHLKHPRRTLLTLLIGNIIVNTLATSTVTLLVLQFWHPRHLGAAMALYALLFIVFCEIVPKVLAARKNILMSILGSYPLRFFDILFKPFRALAEMLANFIERVLKLEKVEHRESVSEDDLKTLVKVGEEHGVFDGQERYMMQKLFELGERPVKEIMVPRVDMRALDVEDSPEEHIETIKKYHFSYFPVYKDSPDHILGYVSIQEYLLSGQSDLERFLKQPLFVPETKRIDELLEEFRKTSQEFCICVDEYGGTAGIVTLEDILEEIFGEYYDEYAKVENPIRFFGKNEYLVNAKIPLSDFCDFFHVEIEPEEAATLGGLILEELGEVPKQGASLVTHGFEVRIQKVVRQRILTVIVKKVSE